MFVISRTCLKHRKENVIIRPDGTAMIGDFGCSRMESATQSIAVAHSHSETKIGTECYWAPEVANLNGVLHSKASDVWSFGMTVYVSNEIRTSRPRTSLLTVCLKASFDLQGKYAVPYVFTNLSRWIARVPANDPGRSNCYWP